MKEQSGQNAGHYQPGIGELENSKIIRSIWKNTFDKILEIKIGNKRDLRIYQEKNRSLLR